MQLIHHGRRKLAIGLDWSLQENKAEAKRAAKLCSATLSVPMGDKIVLAGTEDAAGKTKGLLSAGAFIGLLYPAAIVAYEIPDSSLAWFCAIKDGYPIPGGDSIIERSELRSAVASASAWNNGSIIGSVNGSSLTLQTAFDEVEASIASRAIDKKSLASTSLVPGGFTTKHLMMALLLTVLIVAIGIGSVFYQRHLANQKNLELALKQMMLREKDRLAQEAKIKASIERFKEQVEKARAQFEGSTPTTEQWSACDEIRRGLPLSLYGYVPEKLTCDFKIGKATLRWNQSDKNIRIAGRERLPGITNAFQTEAAPTSEFPLSTPSAQVHIESTPLDSERVKLELMDAVKRKIASFNVEAIIPVTVTPPKEIAEQPGIVPVSIGQEVKWKGQTTGFMERLGTPALLFALEKYPASFHTIEWNQLSRPETTVAVTGSVYVSTH